VKGDDVKQLLADGASDEEIAEWLDANGTPKTAAEVDAWNDEVENFRPYDKPEKKEWFAEECAKVGIDPASSTLFDMLEADDKASF
jgi:hypothetical protein